MRLGLSCARFTWPGGDAAIAERFATLARNADEAGVHSLWVMDHFWQIGVNGPPEEPMLEGYGALSYAAALTSRITLGTLVTGVIYREPGLLVKQATTLDALSGGRAVFGIGAGWNEEESRGLGFPFPPLAERFERLEEALRIALQMWSDDEGAFEGKHYTLARTLNVPQALSRPHPPILIGGSGEKKTLRLVAQYADACNLFENSDVRHKLDVLRGHCDRLGRSYDTIEKTAHMRVGEDQSVDDSVRRAEALAALGIDHVMIGFRDAADDFALKHIAALAPRIADIVPTGR